jgi:hypothetical protein
MHPDTPVISQQDFSEHCQLQRTFSLGAQIPHCTTTNYTEWSLATQIPHCTINYTKCSLGTQIPHYTINYTKCSLGTQIPHCTKNYTCRPPNSNDKILFQCNKDLALLLSFTHNLKKTNLKHFTSSPICVSHFPEGDAGSI